MIAFFGFVLIAFVIAIFALILLLKIANLTNNWLLKRGILLSYPSKKSSKVIHPDTPQQNVTDNLCVICGSLVPGKRIDRHYCSARCRKRASRQGKQLELVKNK
jgi:hypothetical protein